MIKITSEAILAVSLVKLSLTFEFRFSRPETMFFYFFLVFDNQDFFQEVCMFQEVSMAIEQMSDKMGTAPGHPAAYTVAKTSWQSSEKHK